MSEAAVLSLPAEPQEVQWIEMDERTSVIAEVPVLERPQAEFIEVDAMTVSFDSREAMRFGPRAYTLEQAEVIRLASHERAPLRVAPLPLNDEQVFINLRVRRLITADQEAMHDFDCGDEPYETEVSQCIRSWIWEKPKWQEKAIVGVDIDADEAVVGYGIWEHVEAFGTEPIDIHIEIAWFGIASAYKGCVDDSRDQKAADLLYATLEAAAIAHERSTDDMPFTLTCHVDNIRGRRFWEGHGYKMVGSPYAQVEKDRYHRMVR